MNNKFNTLTETDWFSPLLTAEEVGAYLKIGRSTVYMLLQKGDLPCVHIGRAVRVRRVDLQQFVERHLSSVNNPADTSF